MTDRRLIVLARNWSLANYWVTKRMLMPNKMWSTWQHIKPSTTPGLKKIRKVQPEDVFFIALMYFPPVWFKPGFRAELDRLRDGGVPIVFINTKSIDEFKSRDKWVVINTDSI